MIRLAARVLSPEQERKIVDLRIHHGLSKADMAERFGCSSALIGRVLSGAGLDASDRSRPTAVPPISLVRIAASRLVVGKRFGFINQASGWGS